jgi:Tol biopolymer transport system component
MTNLRNLLLFGLLLGAQILGAVANARATQISRITFTPRDENWGSWAPDGVNALFSSGESICSRGQWFCGPQNIWSMRFAGNGELLALDLMVEDAYHPRLSPDGRWAAAMVHNGSDWDIVLWPRNQWSQRVTFQSTAGFQERFPNWSNDSQYLAFDSNRPSDLGTTGYQVYYAPVADPANPQAAVQATFVGSNNKHPTWSADDTELAYVGDALDRRSISAVSLVTGAYRLVTPHDSQNRHPDWSPDGKWIVFTTDRWDGIGDIAIVRASGQGEPIRITEGMNGHDDFAEWNADGTRILFCGSVAEPPYRPNKEMFVASDLPLEITGVPTAKRSMGRLKGAYTPQK